MVFFFIILLHHHYCHHCVHVYVCHLRYSRCCLLFLFLLFLSFLFLLSSLLFLTHLQLVYNKYFIRFDKIIDIHFTNIFTDEFKKINSQWILKQKSIINEFTNGFEKNHYEQIYVQWTFPRKRYKICIGQFKNIKVFCIKLKFIKVGCFFKIDFFSKVKMKGQNM